MALVVHLLGDRMCRAVSCCYITLATGIVNVLHKLNCSEHEELAVLHI